VSDLHDKKAAALADIRSEAGVAKAIICGGIIGTIIETAIVAADAARGISVPGMPLSEVALIGFAAGAMCALIGHWALESDMQNKNAFAYSIGNKPDAGTAIPALGELVWLLACVFYCSGTFEARCLASAGRGAVGVCSAKSVNG
jgi:hypothetical protein